MNLLKRIDDKFEEYLAATLLSFMTVFIFFQVVSRFVFDMPLAWSEEAARFVFVWTIYISAALAVKKREHISVEVGIMFLKGKAKKIAHVFADVIFLVFTIFLLKDGLYLVEHLGANRQLSPAIGLPMNFVYMIIPLGYGLMMLRLIQRIIFDVRHLNDPTEENDTDQQKTSLKV
ncbi:TRAP transporter small permease [Anaerosolibacter sp.]|uniref:TRAP transporter small permease n=1 Tax=Anaerosolibacter sp. TaxID=1872527 RepID=UPI0039EF81FF